MKLHILRHADTITTSASGKDFDRNLTDKGLKQADKLGEYLTNKLNGLEVWCSDAQRTRQTYSAIAKYAQLNETQFLIDLYLCPKETFLQRIWKQESNDDLVIISHNFGISDLVNYFVDDTIDMQTAEYICIEFNCSSRMETSNGTGKITDRYRP